MSDQTLPISFQDIADAAERLHGQARRTPTMTSHTFSEAAGLEVVFKCEQFQRGGAFKFRGAYNRIATLPPEQRERGVIAFSSGNHAQAVALCARIFGIPAVICMPDDAPQVKVEATQGYGAEIVRYDRMKDDREALAQRLSQELGLTLVPPYNDPYILAGQGTAALELLHDVPDLDVIAAPTGGGGLLSGTAVAAHGIRPGIRVVSVGTEAANHAALSLAAGERVRIAPPETLADGIRTTMLGSVTWPVIAAEVHDAVVVSEEEIREAMRFLFLRMKLVVEPTAATTAAAALSGKLSQFGSKAGIILSGGNVSPEVMCEVLNA
jgi:threo-3-hydroxy-L-aspartate ammonia-lyase